MEKFIGGWYTFITGNGIYFIPSAGFYKKLLLNKINYCQNCSSLSKKNIINTCKVYCFACKQCFK